jgi:hypothetical protein
MRRQGLRNAIAQVLGAQWQRCCVHFVRDMLDHVPKTNQPVVRGALKQIFAAPDHPAASDTLAGVVTQLAAVAPKIARLLADSRACACGVEDLEQACVEERADEQCGADSEEQAGALRGREPGGVVGEYFRDGKSEDWDP